MSDSVSWHRDTLTRLLHSPEAEAAIIGAVLITPDAFHDARDAGLKAHHFHDLRRRRLWEACAALMEEGRTPDPVTVGARVPDDVATVGDLALLMADTPSAMMAGDYAAQVIADYTRRELVQLAGDAAKAAYAPDASPTETALNLSRAADDLARSTATARVQTVGDVAQAFMVDLRRWAETRELPGLQTGFAALDKATGGLRREELSIIAARPGMGKSSLAGLMSYAQARMGLRVSVCSLEMSGKEWIKQAIMGRLMIDDARITSEQLERVAQAAHEAEALPMRFYTRGYCTPDELELNIKLHARDLGGLDVVYIDHIGYIAHDNSGAANTAYAIGRTSKRLARIAKEYKCAVVALSQLSRAGETGQREPILTDLRDSGELEQDARLVMFPHRPEYNNREHDPYTPEECKIIIAKNNSGPTGTERLAYVRGYRAFVEYQYAPKANANAQRPAPARSNPAPNHRQNGRHQPIAEGAVAESNIPY